MSITRMHAEMQRDNEFVSERAHKTSKIEDRRKAPERPFVPDAHAQKQRDDRNKKYQKSLGKETREGVLPLSSEATERRAEKIQARIHFKQRQQTKLPEDLNNWKQVSPMLDLRTPYSDPVEFSASVGYCSNDERILCYSRKHKCPHGRHFNDWFIDGSVLIPTCDHDCEVVTQKSGPRCSNCFRQTFIVERKCKCHAYTCTHCRRSFYEHREWHESQYFEPSEVVVMKNYDCHRGQMFMFEVKSNLTCTSRPQNNCPWKDTAIPQANEGPPYKGFKLPSYMPREDSPERPTPQTLKEKLMSYVPGASTFATAQSLVGGAASSFMSHIKSIFNGILSYLRSIVSDNIKSFFKDWVCSTKPIKLIFYSLRFFFEYCCAYLTVIPFFTIVDLYYIFQISPKYGLFRWFQMVFTSCYKFVTTLRPEYLPGVSVCGHGLGKKDMDSIPDYVKNYVTLILSDNTCLDYLTVVVTSLGSIFGITDMETSFVTSDWIYRLKFFSNYTPDDDLLYSREFDFHSQIRISDTPVSSGFRSVRPNTPSSIIDKNATVKLSDYEYPNLMNPQPTSNSDDSAEEQSGTFDFSTSLIKSISYFCKEVLPIASLFNNLTALVERIPRMIVKFLAYFSQDSKQWLEAELSDPTSPLNRYLNCAFLYYKSFINDEAKENAKYSYLGKKYAADALQRCIDENRLDSYVIRWMKDMEQIFSHPQVPDTRQHEPFCIRLVGEPGTGKSTTYRALIAPIFGAKTKEEVDNLCFVKGASEFYDGCANRPVVVFDDFGQNRQSDTDPFDIISLISDAPFMPNLANLVGPNPKGSTYDPKIVITCTNSYSDTTNAIRCPKALSRRFHVVIEVFYKDPMNPTPDSRLYKIVLPQNNRNFQSSSNEPVSSSLYYDQSIQIAWPQTPMPLRQCQEFVYRLYAKFDSSRKVGVSTMEETYMVNLPPILKNTSGRWDTAEPQNDHDILGDPINEKINLAKLKLFISANKLLPVMGVTVGVSTLITAAAQLVMLGTSLYFLYKLVFPTPIQPQPNSSVAKGKVAPPKFVIQSTDNADPQANDNLSQMLNVINQNTITLTIANRTVNGLFVCGTTVLTVEHVFIDIFSDNGSYVADGTPVLVRLPYKEDTICIPFERSNLTPIRFPTSDSDIVLYKLPISKFNQHRNILNYFWSGDYALNNRRIYATDYQPDSSVFKIESSLAKSYLTSTYTVGGRTFNQRLAYGNYQGRKGQCGSPILDASTVTAPILGVHVGKDRSTGHGLFLLVSKQIIEKHLIETPLNRVICEPHCSNEFDGTERGFNHVGGSMEIVGKMTRPLFVASETTLKHSQLFDIIEPHITEPAALHPKDPRIPPETDLWNKALTKLRKQMDPPPIKIFEQSQDDMDEMVRGMPYFGSRRILTLDEAINGTQEFPHLKTIDMSTSCGYPHVLNGEKKDDLFWRNPGTDKLEPTEKFMREYNRAWKMIEEGNVPDFILLTSLKDERRPIEKVKSAKTRLFTVAPLVMNVLLKQFFGPYANMIMENFDSVSYAGKVDRLGSSWSTMMHGLFAKSPIGFGADFGSYDGRLEKARMMRSMRRMLLPIMDDLSDIQVLMAKALITCVTEPWYGFEQMVVSIPGSLASGIWITQILGSDMTHTMLYEAWLSAVPVEFRSMYYFQSFTSLRVMGDDHIVAVIPSMTKWYNGETVCDYFTSLGMEYTSPEKTGKPEPSLPLENISFLKNKTVQKWGMYLPLMEYGAAVEPINWIRKHEFLTDDELTEINVNCSLRAVFFHGEKVFNDLRSRVLSVKPSYRLLRYSYLLVVFTSYGSFPGAQHGENSFYDLTLLPTPITERSPELQILDEYKDALRIEPCMNNSTPSVKRTFTLPKMKFVDFEQPMPTILELSDDTTDIRAETIMKQNLINDSRSNQTSSENDDDFSTLEEYISFTQSEEYKNAIAEKRHQLKMQAEIECAKLTALRLTPETPAIDKKQEKFPPEFLTCVVCGTHFNHQNQLIIHLFSRHQIEYDIVDKNPQAIEDAINYSPLAIIRTTVSQVEWALIGKNFRASTLLGDAILSHGKTFAKACLRRMQVLIHFSNSGRILEFYANLDALAPLGDPVAGESPVVATTKIEETDFLTELVRVEKLLEEKLTIPKLRQAEPQSSDPHSNVPTSAPLTVSPKASSPEENSIIDDPVNEESSALNQLGWTNREKNRLELVSPAGTTQPVSGPRAEASMNDISWSLEKVLMRWNQVGIYKWNLTDAVGASLATLDVVQNLLTTSVVSMPFVNFEKFRCSVIRFKFILVGSKFHQGRLLCGFLPTMASSTLIENDDSIKTLIEVGGVQLDPSSGSDVEYTIPWRHVKGFLDLIAGDCLGQLHIKVLNQLQAVTGSSSSVNVKVLFRMENPEFKIPRPSVGSFSAVVSAHKSLVAPSRFRQAEPQSGENVPTTKNVSSINNMSQNEALPICPVRAITSDASISHFGEKYTTMRDLGKRYRCVQITLQTLTITSYQIVLTGFRVRDLIRDYFPELKPFKLLRGAVNFKLFLSIIDRNVNTKCNIPYTLLVGYNVPADPATTFIPTNIAFSDGYIVNPICRSDESSAAEFSIPFSQMSSTVLHPNAIKTSVNSSLNAEYMIDAEVLLNLAIGTDQTVFAIKAELWMGLSDEFSAGVFCGAPLQVPRTTQGCGFTVSSRSDPTPPLMKNWLIFRPYQQPNRASRVSDDEFVRVEPCGLDDIVDTVLKRVIPDNLVEDAIGALLDKPEISNPPNLIKSRRSDYMSHAVGTQSIEKLQLYPAAQQLTDAEHYGTPRDEMDYRFHIKNRRSLIGTFSWLDTNVEGDVICGGWLGPYATISQPTGTTARKVTLIDYFAKYFTFWRGGITLIFDVVTSAYHEGKLEVTFHPNSLNPPTTYDAKISQYVVSSIIKNTENVFGVTFPYLSDTPWKRIWNGFPLRENAVNNPSPNVQDYMLGYWTCVVAAPLRVPSTVSPSVDVNVYIQAADDFEFNVVSLNSSWLRDPPTA